MIDDWKDRVAASLTQAEVERWMRRVTLLEARLDKIRELLVDNTCTDDSDLDLPKATLSMLRDAYRLAPRPRMPMQEWTPEAADFYEAVYEALPALISVAGNRGNPPQGTLDRIRNDLGTLISKIGDQDRGATPEELIILLDSIEKGE